MNEKRKIAIKIIGRKEDYWYYTVKSWLYEVKDVLGQEYNINIEIKEDYDELDLPAVYVDNELAFIGVPGEEGYLIEVLKKSLDRIVKRE